MLNSSMASIDGAITMLLKCSSVMATPSIRYRLCPLRCPSTLTRLPACCIASPRVPPGRPHDARTEHRQIEKLASLYGQIQHLLAANHIPDFGGLQLHAARLVDDRHHLRPLAHFQGEVAPQPVAGVDFEARQQRLLEVVRAHVQGILAGRQLGQGILAGAVGDGGKILSGRYVMSDDSRVWKQTAGEILNAARDLPRIHLGTDRQAAQEDYQAGEQPHRNQSIAAGARIRRC